MRCLVLKYVYYQIVGKNGSCLFDWVWCGFQNLTYVFGNCKLLGLFEVFFIYGLNWLSFM